ncbi:hypothetical protein F2P81_000637 [Scophthalmus maximus]|uniref:Uncharacterized protein n=1 Tax=Scophthalmus maximus TaxID=52904 RepID=A0A6A4TUY9_SCOMX|nr:hypothetical protein F2P81_000637 [Scophthalmus maximus]
MPGRLSLQALRMRSSEVKELRHEEDANFRSSLLILSEEIKSRTERLLLEVTKYQCCPLNRALGMRHPQRHRRAPQSP